MKIIYYVGLSIFLVVLTIFGINYFVQDIEKSFHMSSILIQTIAIVSGGLWAFHKFGWQNKFENVVKLKGSLMNYAQRHNLLTGEYRHSVENEGISKKDAYLRYATQLLDPYNRLLDQVHLSYLIPKKLRMEIMRAIYLTIGNNHGKDLEDLSKNWEEFGRKVREIDAKLEKQL
ncbi:hypothetical protein KC725_00010 [Candidatus Peregrinibacteria bacterium]|nr:hypothetical protein [Candidatus Peregrinibacteria bacterium]